MKKSKAWPFSKYRKLKKGEIIESGDIVFSVPRLKFVKVRAALGWEFNPKIHAPIYREGKR